MRSYFESSKLLTPDELADWLNTLPALPRTSCDYKLQDWVYSTPRSGPCTYNIGGSPNWWRLTLTVEQGGTRGRWFDANLGKFIDDLFVFDQDFEVIRGDTMSHTSPVRRNANRFSGGKWLGIWPPSSGPPHRARAHDDAKITLVRRSSWQVANRAARPTNGAHDTKLLSERDLKLPKAMKDMFVMLAAKKPQTIAQLETFSLITFGRTFIMLRMDCPNGYVSCAA
ncbi:hypothetical protein BC940DRAFT_316514 [Gongronella butleri]|nr:hypothetical protein BC940DRAFT_316514 [Gongronella butleri]